MPKAPKITGKEMVSALEKAGFRLIRTKGSHHFMKNEQGQVTVVPVHSGETLGLGLFAKILRDCDLTLEEFKTHL